jgi:hypothetical protein
LIVDLTAELCWPNASRAWRRWSQQTSSKSETSLRLLGTTALNRFETRNVASGVSLRGVWRRTRRPWKIFRGPDVIYTSSSFELVGWQMVGGYALQPRWDDGHNTGLYSFAYLRRLIADS